MAYLTLVLLEDVIVKSQVEIKLQEQYGTYSPVYLETVRLCQVGRAEGGLTHIFHTGLCVLNFYFCFTCIFICYYGTCNSYCYYSAAM